MEPISTLHTVPSQQITEKILPDPTPWQAFFKEFKPCERAQFLRNMQHHFSQMIWKHMRKSKEAMQKLKESYH
ncbi:MAG: hypothetical protein AB7N99_04250 [Simkaniaceae bacterium]